jgi:hydrogenase maturation factor
VSLFVGEIDRVREGADGRWGTVSVRGARLEVALDLLPEARVGDAVLVHAGVALARMGEGLSSEEETPCV